MSDIANRIEKNFAKLEGWAEKLGLDAYRIYDRDIPDYPYIVDRYLDYAVVFDRSDDEIDADPKKKSHYTELIQAVKDVLKVSDDHIVLKLRRRQKGEAQYEKIDEKKQRLIVREGPARFYVNLHDYLDTGLFLDHRLMRDRIRKESSVGKRVLNLFSYTGAVSVFAALGGARVTSVDLSQTYTVWAQDNFRLNKLDLGSHEFIAENALEYLASNKDDRSFDLVFLDPPTFSNSKKMERDFEVERDQIELVDLAMRKLKPGGRLYFSNNKRTFKLDSKIEAGYAVRDISLNTIPKDFRDQKIHKVYQIEGRNYSTLSVTGNN